MYINGVDILISWVCRWCKMPFYLRFKKFAISALLYPIRQHSLESHALIIVVNNSITCLL